MRLVVEAFDLIIAERKIRNIGRQAEQPKRPMLKIATIFMRATEANFESQGRRGGGSWRRLSAEWMARKAKKGWDPRILHATGALRRSVTRKGDPNMVMHMSGSGYTLTLGSRLPYAARHQRTRPYLAYIESDLIRAENVVLEHLMEGFQSRRSV